MSTATKKPLDRTKPKLTMGREIPWKTVAKSCDITEKTLIRYRKLEGFPKARDIKKIKAWITENRQDGKVMDQDVDFAALGGRKKIAETKEKEARAQLATIEVDVLEGRLIQFDDIKAKLERVSTAVKNDMLSIPSQLRQRLSSYLRDPAESGVIENVAEELVRDALEKCVENLLKEE